MKSVFDKLNLQPGERRLVVGVAIVLFIVLNLWFVWPHFDDWRTTRQNIADLRETLNRYQTEVNRIAEYEAKLAALESTGTEVASEEQALQLQTIVLSQARRSGVDVSNVTPGEVSRQNAQNQFFDERSLTIRIATGDKELVDFLVNLASSSSMIRVRDIDIKPEQNQHRLQGSIIFVASYQKSGARTNSIASASAALSR